MIDRLFRVAGTGLLTACVATFSDASLRSDYPEPMTIPARQADKAAAVISVGITVSDLDQAIDFYTNTLAFRKISQTEQAGSEIEQLSGVFGARVLTARLQLGEEIIELTQFLAPEGRPIPQDSRSNDRWFQHIAIAVSDIDKAYSILRSHKVRHASSGPQTLPSWNTNAAGISAFYFKDPDGHVLEVIHFPAGKGNPRWQKAADPEAIFLGIDHTAIVVAHTDESLKFYRDRLGLKVVGGSENYGTEQEHLNNIFGARLRITTLRAPAGPGIEFLEYLSPATGRLYPADSAANDLWHWHTNIAADLGFVTGLRASPDISHISAAPADKSPPSSSHMIRDPDGHAVMLISRPDPNGNTAQSQASHQ